MIKVWNNPIDSRSLARARADESRDSVIMYETIAANLKNKCVTRDLLSAN